MLELHRKRFFLLHAHESINFIDKNKKDTEKFACPKCYEISVTCQKNKVLIDNYCFFIQQFIISKRNLLICRSVEFVSLGLDNLHLIMPILFYFFFAWHTQDSIAQGITPLNFMSISTKIFFFCILCQYAVILNLCFGGKI